MRNLRSAVPLSVNAAAIVGMIYYLIPGFLHLFAIDNPRDIQPTHVAICVILFFVSMQFTPPKNMMPKCAQCNVALIAEKSEEMQ